MRNRGEVGRVQDPMRAFATLLAAVLLAGCSSSDAPPRAALVESASPLTEVAATVDPGEATFFLVISNQSFAERRAEITVTVDGRRVVARAFDVGGQHNYVSFPLDVPPGRHALEATTGSGTRHRETFELPPSGVRWGTLLYWNDGLDAPFFSWTFKAEPPAFG